MMIVADNLHGLNPVIVEAMEKLQPKPVQDLAVRCVEAGAELLDINPGFLSRRREDRMSFLVEAVQEVTSVPLILDSPIPRVLARGLAVCRQKPVLSALSLEEKKIQEILPLAAEHETPLVLLLMDEQSFSPHGMEEKLAVAIELRERALAAGLKQEALIFDPVLPNLAWHDAFSLVAEVVKTIRILSDGTLFQEGAQTMAGLSNLRSGLRRRYSVNLEATCLAALCGAGLGYALINVLEPELVQTCHWLTRLCPRLPNV